MLAASAALAGLAPTLTTWVLANPVAATNAGVITADVAAQIANGAVTPVTVAESMGGKVGAAGAKAVETSAATMTAGLDSSLARIAQDGHALERHGGLITNEQLFNRALTGVGPDGSSVVRNGQILIPSSATAFNSNALLAQADELIRQNYLDRAIALSKPGAQSVVIEGAEMGIVVGRGFDRVLPVAGSVGPPQFNDGLSRVTAVYSYDASVKYWRTTTIYPVK